MLEALDVSSTAAQQVAPVPAFSHSVTQGRAASRCDRPLRDAMRLGLETGHGTWRGSCSVAIGIASASHPTMISQP